MSQAAFSATPAEERLEHIDLVRGYALLGVLLMNIQYWFRGPNQLYRLNPHPFPGTWNALTDNLLEVWFSGKSVTIFAMLFAVGLCMQRDSILDKGQKWLGFGLRRLFVMLGLGALHVSLLWMGDVLNGYALSGFLILPFLKRQPRTLSWWAGSLLGLMALVVLGFSIAAMVKGPQFILGGADQKEEALKQAQSLIQGYSQHSWWAVMKFRLGDFGKFFLRAGPFIVLGNWINFMIGLWIWKRNILQNPAAHLPTIRRVAAWGLTLGLPACVLANRLRHLEPFLVAHWTWVKFLLPALGIILVFSTLALALGILFGLVWLWFQPAWRERIRPITFVGRMGFTNYIAHSVVCGLVFDGWGLGGYGKVSPFSGLLIGLGLFALQIPFSRWWLGQFRFGPLEWVWRALSYGKRPRMRRTEPPEAAVAEA